MQRTLFVPVVLAAAVFSAPPVQALNEVIVRAPGAPSDLEQLLERSSNTRRALEEAGDTPLLPGEVLSEARSEYRQMLGALYSEGYYGGAVSVLVDGRQASELSLTSPPAQINRVVIEVEPGP